MFGQWMGWAAKELMTQERLSSNEGWALVHEYPRLIVPRRVNWEGCPTSLPEGAQGE